MSFGQSAPPATAKQVAYLLSLVQKAGHVDFRDARGPLRLTQRQAAGKFSRAEASTLIDQLLAEDDVDGHQISAETALGSERAALLSGVPADDLAGELQRRGWTVSPPA